MGNTATGGDSGKRTVRLDVLYPDPRKKTATMAKKEPSVVLSSNKPDWKTCSQLQQLASTAWKRQTSKKQASETTPMSPKSPRKVAKKEDVEQKNRRKQMRAKLDAFRNPLRASARAKHSDDSSDDSSDSEHMSDSEEMAKKEPSVVLSSNKPDWKTCSQLQQLASTAWKRQTSKKQASETTPMSPKSPRKVAKKEDVEQKNRRKQMQAKLDAFRNPLRASARAKRSDDSSDDSSDSEHM